ncbi:Succinylglutamate desuccinylase / Aspartoacylase family protein [Prosthecobacter debontii]|uniref:Succinylglutamate desuccinylase / Aspartoacylase family protein n=1 Tax=Prosthecobacter debontii TaxID=48467 RepID=A0A1T4Y644_9BACT|nr:succinylglutamate desuccinylase/aspartoacylase family protein [Prosthecobacter debontii]SKA97123.1 Succinylglutamate desuccinylase / Aspartoacylase family protein [Prosthecobacter debontii]
MSIVSTIQLTRDRLSSQHEFQDSTDAIFIPKLVFPASKKGMCMKFGVFAGVHGDEDAGILAVHELIQWASTKPVELEDFELHFYPICNPSGCTLGTRHSHSGLDLNREFWVGSDQPEIQYLEQQLRAERYEGILALHSDDTSDGCYGFVSGSLLSEQILEPALAAAHEILPRNEAYVIDGFLAEHGIIKEGYHGILSAPPEQRPHAMEVVFETPALAPINQQVAATVIAVKTMLAQYRLLQAYAPNL